MAVSQAVWGIEIGRCALKALRCRLEGDSVVADAFDFIEYPKLLSQPDADVPALVREALKQFLERNTVRGDKVAIAVSGESGLAKYFKPPPVDKTRIPDIVKYEAKQQIPFPLPDVIWDHQLMPGYQENDGFVMDAEIGLFAMKREQVFKVLQPYKEAGIEVDIIQLAPLAVYNFVAYDLADLKEPDKTKDYDPERPPPHNVVMSIGTDTTDLLVTNGYRLWQRNVPMGGNHFTKQLSKDLKLTFAKAEHLKRNPKQADDPRAIFTAMRPVFSDIVTEVQRSVSFYRSLDRKADIKQLVMLGNTVKLPGLAQYVEKHLGYKAAEVDSYRRLNGSAVVSNPSFKENMLSFATCYGLCVQGLGKGKLNTNLIPQELLKERAIRAKKPWAVAATGVVLLACAFNFIFHYMTWNEVHPSRHLQEVTWSDAKSSGGQAVQMGKTFETQDTEKATQVKKLKLMGEEVVGSADRKLLWLELMYAINNSLPVTPELAGAAVVPKPDKLPFEKRQELHIEYLESEYFADLKTWYHDAVRAKHEELVRQLKAGNVAEDPAGGEAAAEDQPAQAGQPTAQPGQPTAQPGQPAAPKPGGPVPAGPQPGPGAPGGATAGKAAVAGPTGPGWVIELHGFHYYRADNAMYGPAHVRATLLKQLEEGEIELPLEDGTKETFTMKELGIGYPLLSYEEPIDTNATIRNPFFEEPTNLLGGGAFGEVAPMDDPMKKKKEVDPNKPVEPRYYKVSKYTFAVQFCWQEKRLTERLRAREEKAKAAAGGAGGNAAPPAAAAAGGPVPITPAGNPGAPK